VTKLKKGIGDHVVTLIGETRPFQSATLYAKVSGYLKNIYVDKGDIVKEGKVLAVIESPETDQAYLAAEADAKNKQAILARMKNLYAKQLVSQQEFDQAQADSDVANAKLSSQRTQKGYETLKAPFTGTITARYADPGALVQNAMNSESSALPVVLISEIKRLRIDVFLDQRDAPYVRNNDPVTITLAERPGFKMEGHVARISGELDPRTKMLLTEIDIPNEDRSLVAGSFVQISMQIKSPPYVEAPVEAVVLKGNKTYISAVSPDGKIQFKPVEIGSNDGKVITVLSGADEGDMVALNIGDSLPEGSKVRPIVDTPPPAAKK
jgi:RND family efflux transporter MFP subunit